MQIAENLASDRGRLPGSGAAHRKTQAERVTPSASLPVMPPQLRKFHPSGIFSIRTRHRVRSSMSKQIFNIDATRNLIDLAGRWRKYAAATDDADYKAMMLRTAEALEQTAEPTGQPPSDPVKLKGRCFLAPIAPTSAFYPKRTFPAAPKSQIRSAFSLLAQPCLPHSGPAQDDGKNPLTDRYRFRQEGSCPTEVG